MPGTPSEKQAACRFFPIEEAEAIAASAPAYEEGEISSGQFGGSPLLPPEDVTTLEVATDLIADRNVPAEQITQLTRSLFEDRQKMVAESALASFVKAASTDKDAAIPVHPGAKVYYDGEEQTFVEKYGDWVYIGPIIFGALASVAMAVLRFLGISRIMREPPLLAKVPEVIQAIDNAGSAEALDSIRSRINAAVERVSMDAVEGRGSEQNMGAIAIAVLTWIASYVIATINSQARRRRPVQWTMRGRIALLRVRRPAPSSFIPPRPAQKHGFLLLACSRPCHARVLWAVRLAATAREYLGTSRRAAVLRKSRRRTPGSCPRTPVCRPHAARVRRRRLQLPADRGRG